MNRTLALAGVAALLLPLAAHAAPAKTKMAKMKPTKMAKMKPAKMVTVYQAEKCHMYFTPAQAKKDNYACPDSKGKMHMVKMTPAAAKKALMPAKKAM